VTHSCGRSRHRRLRPNAAGHQDGIPCLVIERPQRKGSLFPFRDPGILKRTVNRP